MTKLTDVEIRNWIKTVENFEMRGDGDALYLSYRSTFSSPIWRFRYRFSCTQWTSQYIMAARKWIPEQRVQQSLKIRQWEPWMHSAGARTVEGKAISARNAFNGGLMQNIKLLGKQLNILMCEQKQRIKDIQQINVSRPKTRVYFITGNRDVAKLGFPITVADKAIFPINYRNSPVKESILSIQL